MNKNLLSRILWGICLGIMSMATTTAYAKTDMNLLIHTQSAAEQSIPLRSISQITFSKKSVNIELKNASPISVLFSNLSYLSFSEVSSAIEELPADLDLSATYRRAEQCMEVKSTLPIQSVRIYNMQGNLVQQVTPQVTEAIIPLDHAPQGIYIVIVSTERETISQKFIKH